MFLKRFLADGCPNKGADLSTAQRWIRHLFAQFAVLDWILLVYLAILTGSAFFAPDSAERTLNLRRLFWLGSSFAAALVWVRSGLAGKGVFASLLYRIATFTAVLGSYFLLQKLLPIANHRVFDEELYSLDMLVFRFEPAVVMDRYVTPSTTEWFAFFYYSYFFLLSAYVFPMLFLTRRMRLLGDFCLAFASLYCVGHVLYIVVPGYGPFRYLAEQFVNPLPQGFWYQRVLNLVQSAGAIKDIFPSLHTAGPFICFLFAFRYRKLSPFKYVWIPTAFFSANIIIATMFLRWHYIIDIIAGISLSLLIAFLSVRLSAWEERRRKQLQLQPAWMPLWQSPQDPIEPQRIPDDAATE